MQTKPIEVYTSLFKRLKDLECPINKAIDVGAHQGKWAERLKEFYPDVDLYLVDSNTKYKNELEKHGKFFHGYIGQHKEKRTFYTSAAEMDETGNSLYRENSNTPFKKIEVETIPLQDLVPDQKYDYIKMDVQGAELEIFEGSLKLFMATKWVQLEVPVFQNNKDAPNFEQVVNYMANSAFKVFDIENIYFNARLMGIDILFRNTTLKDVIPTEENIIHYSHHDSKRI